MLYSYGALQPDEKRALVRISQLRRELQHYVRQEPRRWTGLIARMTRARALRASNSIEGINVSAEDAVAVVDNEDPAEADRATLQAVQGYQAAMDYILQRCRNETFKFSEDVILAIHFMISQHDLDANPGNYRSGWVGVRDTASGEYVHEGVDRDKLEPLIAELVTYMNDDDVSSFGLKAAMVHLNLTLMHPFSDGNGRTARCLQTAVLARSGTISPIFSSIEEYIGRNQHKYYDVLAEVGGGGWHPDRDCRPWVRFCIEGHYRQAQTLLRRHRQTEAMYNELLIETSEHSLPERTAIALLEAASGNKVRNSSYRVGADLSNNQASRDLKALVDSGLLVSRGERRGRYYLAGDAVTNLQERHRLRRLNDDPFAED